MAVLFAANLLIALIWPILIRGNVVADLVVGFVLGMLLLSFVEPEYGARGVRVPIFILVVLWEVLRGALSVAWTVLQPHSVTRQGVVAIPLQVSTPFEITLLASVITLTPGTMSVNLGTDDQGERVLFVHVLSMTDPDEVRTAIKEQFERRILTITRGKGVTP